MTKLILTALAVLALAPFAAAQQEAGRSRTGMPAAGLPQTGLSDAEVADFMKAANDAEIQAAKSAITRAKSKEVKRFAQSMIEEHTKSNSDLAQVQRANGIAPEESQLSRALRDQSKTDNAAAIGLEGKDFDQAYIEQQVKSHQTVLSTIDTALSSGQQRSEEFKTLLNEMRRKVSKHLEHAQRLQTKLGRRRE